MTMRIQMKIAHGRRDGHALSIKTFLHQVQEVIECMETWDQRRLHIFKIKEVTTGRFKALPIIHLTKKECSFIKTIIVLKAEEPLTISELLKLLFIRDQLRTSLAEGTSSFWIQLSLLKTNKQAWMLRLIPYRTGCHRSGTQKYARCYRSCKSQPFSHVVL